MAFRSSIWMLKRCLQEERKRGPFSHLASVALDKGLLGTDATRGHFNQAWGAAQAFLQEYPQHLGTIKQASAIAPFLPPAPMLANFRSMMAANAGDFGKQYSWDTLKNILTPQFGGTVTGGGGGDHELKVVLRLAAEFL